MGVSPDYFVYPHRHSGLDHSLFDMRYMRDVATRFSNGKSVAIWITIDVDFFPLDMPKTPFLPTGGLSRPYPDLWNYTTREYGNRVGIYRLLRALEKQDVAATLFVQSSVCELYAPLMRDLVASGHEIAAGGVDMGHLHYGGLERETESALVRRALDTLSQATGRMPAGWHSPAFSQSFNTPELLAEAGVRYMCDWVNDEMPYPVKTSAGALVNLPMQNELSDKKILFEQNQSLDAFCSQVMAAFHWLKREATPDRARILPISISPWIMGQPYRIRAFERLLSQLLDDNAVFATTGVALIDELGPQTGGTGV